MWWVVPFGLMLAVGVIAAISWTVGLVSDLPRGLWLFATPVVAVAVLGPILRPAVRAIDRWLVAQPRHQPIRLDLNG